MYEVIEKTDLFHFVIQRLCGSVCTGIRIRATAISRLGCKNVNVSCEIKME